MDSDFDLIKDYVTKMQFQCEMFRRSISSQNIEAKTILANFYEQLSSLQKVLEELAAPIDPVNENPLTPREVEILGHVSSGFTNKEIASALSVSPKTVEFHISSILKKTHAASRAEAITNAMKYGWLTI